MTATRFNFWYGGFHRSNGFDSNAVNRLPYDTSARVGSLYPSDAETALLSWMNFPAVVRPEETRVFAGIMRVPSCRAGVYRFRVRSDDDTDMFVDHSAVLSNPGRHTNGATTKEAVVELKPNTDHQFEVSPVSRTASMHLARSRGLEAGCCRGSRLMAARRIKGWPATLL